jgi:hypothetical protein
MVAVNVFGISEKLSGRRLAVLESLRDLILVKMYVPSLVARNAGKESPSICIPELGWQILSPLTQARFNMGPPIPQFSACCTDKVVSESPTDILETVQKLRESYPDMTENHMMFIIKNRDDLDDTQVNNVKTVLHDKYQSISVPQSSAAKSKSVPFLPQILELLVFSALSSLSGLWMNNHNPNASSCCFPFPWTESPQVFFLRQWESLSQFWF